MWFVSVHRDLAAEELGHLATEPESWAQAVLQMCPDSGSQGLLL